MLVRLLSAVLAVVVALPGIARAAPATVKVFEAPARSAPRADAPVVHVFAEGAVVSVAERPDAGWRKVRLPDGGVAWVDDGALWLTEAPAARAAPRVLAASAPAGAVLALPAVGDAGQGEADLRGRIYVKDLDHLAELVRADPDVGPQARRLEQRRRAAMTAGVVGFGASIALLVTGFVRMNRAFDRAIDSPDDQTPGNDGIGLVLGGLGTSAATPLLMWAIAPKRHDLLDVINTWNARHPAEPFELRWASMHHGGRR